MIAFSLASLALLSAQTPTTPLPDAELALNERLPVLPLPKHLLFYGSKRLEISGKIEYPAGVFMHADQFRETLSRRFDLSSAPGPAIQFDGGISDLKLPKQAFDIEIDKAGVHVFGQDEVGLQLGLRRLALLAYSENGHLYMPMGQIIDYPSIEWRGFELSVGPQARPFQLELARRVLIPLGFNEAVLHCEQTAWDATPKPRGKDVMPKADLAALCKWYRGNGVDPIPLAESFGHAEWLFAGGDNADLAVDPKQPSVIDPRKPGSGALLDKVWSEILDTTRATTVHFGGNEFNLTGIANSSDLLNTLWSIQIPALTKLAAKNGVKMMLWGNQMLGPGEAIDNCLAESVAAATVRRTALATGTLIGDVHLRNTLDFARFFPSLDLWEQGDMKPIATSWLEPANLRSSAITAVQRKAGVLKTTDASVISGPTNPYENFNEFASFILTAEFAWSGRQDDIGDLHYDYRDVFRRMYFQSPVRVTAGAGVAIGAGPGEKPQSVGRYRYIPVAPTSSLAISSTAKSLKMVAFLTAEGTEKPGTLVASLKFKLADGTIFTRPLVYGWQIRGKSDTQDAKEPSYCPGAEFGDGVFAVRVTLPSPAVGVSIEALPGAPKVSLVGLDALK